MLSIIILMLIFMPKTLAKYSTSEKLISETDIAEPIFIVEGTETTKISSINNIGYYEFSIKNYNETNVSETGFLYTIEVISKTDESIQFELYRENKKIELENLKTANIEIKGNERMEQKYKLKVTYDKVKGSEGKDILQEVQIKVHSEQQRVG